LAAQAIQEVSRDLKNVDAAIDCSNEATVGRHFLAPPDDVRGNHASASPDRTPVDLQSVTDLCEMSVNWLNDVIPSKSVAIWFSCLIICKASTPRATKPVLISHGSCPLEK
jgi:hypothetical protein